MIHNIQENIGKKFNKLTIIKFDCFKKQNKYNKPFYICLCECGNSKSISLPHLKDNGIKSCGCLRKLTNGLSQKNHLYSQYKWQSKRRKIQFSLTKEEFISFLDKNCYYCNGKPSSRIYNNQVENNFILYNGIDRLDNKKGYLIDNCVACCGYCNGAKNDLTKEEFFNRVKQICQNHKLI